MVVVLAYEVFVRSLFMQSLVIRVAKHKNHAVDWLLDCCYTIDC